MSKSQRPHLASEPESCRIDIWLWRARFMKTRPLAAAFVEGGKVRRGALNPNAKPTRLQKPGTPIRPGDVLVFALGSQALQVRVEALGERRGPASEAQALYTLLNQDPARASPLNDAANPD